MDLKGFWEPGPDCLSAEDMAEALDRGVRPDHAGLCLRCALEWKALRPRRAVRRRRRTNVWAAAAAVVLAAVSVWILWKIGTRPGEKPEPEVVRQPGPKPVPERPRPETPEPEPEKPKPEPEPEKPEPKPEPEKPKPEPEPEPEKPKPEPTRPEPAVRREVAVAVSSGRLSTKKGRKWVRVETVLEDMPLRADGRTTVLFAGAKVTLERYSEVSLAKERMKLTKGTISAEIPSEARFGLLLQDAVVLPASHRVILTAKPDRVVVDEGAARSGETVLREGVEFRWKEGSLLAQKRRSLPRAKRAREIPVSRIDMKDLDGKLPDGKVAMDGRRPVLVSTPRADQTYSYGGITWRPGAEVDVLTVKKTTAIRFVYFVDRKTTVRLSLRNRTRDENFSLDFAAVTGGWTTMTLFVDEIPVNVGGRKVACEAGDRYGWVSWTVGTKDAPAEIRIADVQILEIER